MGWGAASGRRGRAATVAVVRRCGVTAVVALAGAASPATAAPLEAIAIEREIAPPPGFTWVDAVGAAFFLPDGEHVVATVAAQDGSGGPQVGVARRNGSAFRCLTCGLLGTTRAPQAFPDGRRLFVSGSLGDEAAVGGQGTGDAQSYVLECAPSLLRCDERTLVDVTFPIDALTEPPSAQNREAGIHPAGEYVKWGEVRSQEGQRMTIGRLVRTATEYVVEQPRVMNPAFALDGTLEDFLAGSRFYEAQGYTDGWTDGGRVMKYGATTTAANYDIWELDLTTGGRRRLTDDLDYQENGDYSPDGSAIAYGTGRGLDRMDVFTALERPALLDVVTFAQLGRVGLHNNRRCMNERWLMSRSAGEQRGGYGGQPVVLDDDWALRSWSWSADGTRALVVEDRIERADYTTGDVSRPTRMRVLRFPGRRPVPTPEVHRLTDADLARSTVAYEDYTGLATRFPVARRIASPHGGSAAVTYAGTFAGGRFEVVFDGYEHTPGTRIDGTEALELPNPLVASRYTADLTATGARPGRMRADLVLRGREARGTIRTNVGATTYDGIRTQFDCPGLRRPALRLVVLARRALRGGRVALDVRVTATVPDDGIARPVRGLTVRAQRGGRGTPRRPDGRAGLAVGARRPVARTDARGRARLIVLRRGVVRLRAESEGFAPAVVTTRAGR